MGNAHAKPHPRPRNKKQVHWKAADRPSPPGKPRLADNDLTPDLVTVVWSKPLRDGGSPINGYLVEHRRTGSPHWVRATPLMVPFPELTISGLEPGWRYQFRVRAENAVGLSDPSEISEPLTVTLQKYAITAPKFTEELKDATVLENEKVEFAVHFMGQPPPKICWYKDGFEIFSSRRTRILTETDRSILTIHQSALSDEGEIKCTATNKAGHTSTKARLSLEAPPSIRLPRQYEDGLLFEIGEVLRLKVSVAGRPTPLVFWSHNGETIQNNDRYEIEYVDKCSILKLGEAERTDRGEYQIKAVNKIGQDCASFLVTITDKPSPPGRARVVMTLGRSVTLSWSSPDDDGGCKIGNYIVEYFRLGWNVWLKAATSRQLTTILGDLIEGSEYKFRVKAESPYGVSDPGEESDIVFIPDAKRGITSPQARSRSQPKDILDEMAVPIVVNRKNQPRSQSSMTKMDIFDEIPIRPQRTKIKSLELSPKTSKKVTEVHTVVDRASIARELSYGSPEIKVKLDVPGGRSPTGKSRSPSPASKVSRTPSPNDDKPESPNNVKNSPSPVPETKSLSLSPQVKRSLIRGKSEEDSSEFMLVLYPDAIDRGQRKDSNFNFDDYEIPPPISLSAPELGAEPPIFSNLKLSASSTELLHERAIIRFNEAAEAAEKEELCKKRQLGLIGQRSIEIPKIQINSLDDQDLVGLERRSSRRKSTGGVAHQQLLWAQRRYSLKNPPDPNDAIESKLRKSPTSTGTKTGLIRQRSESEEREEEEFERVRARMALQGQSSLEKRSIKVVDEDKWLEDYEESLSESETETESSEDDRRFDEVPILKGYSDEEEGMYHPGMMLKNSVNDAPFEILSKRNNLPDPNFVPKPILKNTDEKILRQQEVPKEVVTVKPRSQSPMPQVVGAKERSRSKSLAQPSLNPPSVSSKIFKRSFSLGQKEGTNEPELDKPVAPGHSISAVASICGIAAASIVIPGELLKKKKDEEESKVLVDHYTDIVKNYGQRRASTTQIPSWKTAVEHQVAASLNPIPPTIEVERKPAVPHEPKRNNIENKVEDCKPIVRLSRPSILKEPSNSITRQQIAPQKREKSPSPIAQRGRTITHTPRQGLSSPKTPTENWGARRKTSPSPLKKKRSSPSPIPTATAKPKLKEIMTQTSIGLELNYSSDSRASSPNYRHQELIAQAEVKVRGWVDYITDLTMFCVACWLYLFNNELLAVPILLIMVFRQLKNAIRKRIPRWMQRKFRKPQTKKHISQ